MDIENEEFLLFLKCAHQNNLRYLAIGGYAVNYFGFHRWTDDLDIWIAPTNENKICFLDTLKCMGYSDSEVDDIRKEDFSTYFMCSLGSPPNLIDILTIIHKNVNFDLAEKDAVIHRMENGIILKLIPYDFLKEVKLLSRRDKDLWDVARLDELMKLKNNKNNTD